MDIKDMKIGVRYRVAFEGVCLETNGFVGIKPDGIGFGSHILRDGVNYTIEEIAPVEPDHNNVIKMSATYPQDWLFYWSDTFEKWAASNSVSYTWGKLLDVAKRNGHTIKVYSLTEVKSK